MNKKFGVERGVQIDGRCTGAYKVCSLIVGGLQQPFSHLNVATYNHINTIRDDGVYGDPNRIVTVPSDTRHCQTDEAT